MNASRIAAFPLLLLPALPAQAGALSPSSFAFGAETSFLSGGVTSGFGPVTDASGSGSQGYNVTATAWSANQTVLIGVSNPAYPFGSGGPTLYASESTLTSDASGGSTGTTVSAHGFSDVVSTSFTLVGFAPSSQTLPWTGNYEHVAYLTVSATNVTSTANWSEVLPSAVSASGGATFGYLTIGGSLVNYGTLNFQGAAPANDVLYNQNGVTITLDQQTKASPYSIATDALDIQLVNANLGDRTVTGNFIVGQTFADPFPAPAPSGLVAMLTGLGTLGWLRRRRSVAPAA
jgi:hypothetical protein